MRALCELAFPTSPFQFLPLDTWPHDCPLICQISSPQISDLAAPLPETVFHQMPTGLTLLKWQLLRSVSYPPQLKYPITFSKSTLPSSSNTTWQTELGQSTEHREDRMGGGHQYCACFWNGDHLYGYCLLQIWICTLKDLTKLSF
jgi:hypothetical protein